MNLSERKLIISFSCITDMPLIVSNGWLWLVFLCFLCFFLFFLFFSEGMKHTTFGVPWLGLGFLSGFRLSYPKIPGHQLKGHCTCHRILQQFPLNCYCANQIQLLYTQGTAKPCFFCLWVYPSGDMDWTCCLSFFPLCLSHVNLSCHLSWELYCNGFLKATSNWIISST